MHDELTGVALFFKKQTNSIIRRVTGKRTYYDAQRFVATDEVSGRAQAEILFAEGATADSHVLEVGCGCLSAGLVLIERLNADRYVGIEPNDWLVDASLRRKDARAIAEPKRPVFVANLDFDASSTGRTFDFVLSHSILSHAAHWQLPRFLKNVGACLAPGGKIFASLILAEGNPYGSKGAVDGKDSMDQEWVYPGVSYFTKDTVAREASEAGLEAILRHDITDRHTKVRPLETHDWYEFRLRSAAL
jgi:cyclopropane fatty-acyl-phospholipid synthase-like methyltransferase